MNQKDISEVDTLKKRADSTSLRGQEALFQKEMLTKEVLDGVPDVVLILNRYRQIVFFNLEALKYAKGKSKDEIIGMRPGEFFGCIHSSNETGGCGTTRFCKVCGAAQVMLCGAHGRADTQECRIRCRDGETLNLLVWGRPFHYRGEQYTQFSIQDISASKRLHQLERMFFHDILNTAGGIRNFVEVLGDLGEEQHQESKQILRNLCNEMIEEIQLQRDIKGAENGELDVLRTVQSLTDIIRPVIDRYGKKYPGGNRSVHFESDCTDDRVCTDASVLRRCLAALVKNAMEAAKSGEQVWIVWHEIEGSVQVCISNPECMQREVQMQIFQRAYSTKDHNRGIGTYGVKLIVERYLKGRVWFESDREEGTKFYVTIPKE